MRLRVRGAPLAVRVVRFRVTIISLPLRVVGLWVTETCLRVRVLRPRVRETRLGVRVERPVVAGAPWHFAWCWRSLPGSPVSRQVVRLLLGLLPLLLRPVSLCVGTNTRLRVKPPSLLPAPSLVQATASRGPSRETALRAGVRPPNVETSVDHGAQLVSLAGKRTLQRGSDRLRRAHTALDSAMGMGFLPAPQSPPSS